MVFLVVFEVRRSMQKIAFGLRTSETFRNFGLIYRVKSKKNEQQNHLIRFKVLCWINFRSKLWFEWNFKFQIFDLCWSWKYFMLQERESHTHRNRTCRLVYSEDAKMFFWIQKLVLLLMLGARFMGLSWWEEMIPFLLKAKIDDY